MSQKTNSKRILDNEAISIGKNIRVSPQKLNLVAQSIRGVDVSKAVANLTFSKKRILEAQSCTIRNYTLKSQAGQKETQTIGRIASTCQKKQTKNANSYQP